MERHTEHIGGDRYALDCGRFCGYAQLDTDQDAPYSGAWACPERLEVATFTEGELTVTRCDGPEQFAAEVQRFREFADRMGRFLGVDAGLNPAAADTWRAVGLGALLH